MFPITLVFFYTFAPDFYGELWTNGHCCDDTSLTIVFHPVANVRMSLVAVHKSVSAETTCEWVTVHWYCTACLSAPVYHIRVLIHTLTHTQCGISFWGI